MKTINLNMWIGLLCVIGLFGMVFNDDPLVRVLAWGFLGVITTIHVVSDKKK